jgi:DNA-binding NtrC family response regulator
MLSPSPSLPFGILVVEDEPAVLRLLLGYLRNLGVAAYGASGAAEAERVLREHEGEIGGALIDLCMPLADGVETRRVLDRVKPGLRCCLMSGAGLAGEALPEGFCHGLDKPFGMDEVRACLDVLAAARPLAEGRAG